MQQYIVIESEKEFVFEEFRELLGMDDMELVISPDEVEDAWGFQRKGKNGTMFTIVCSDGRYMLMIDNMSSYDDFRLFPYLADTLNEYLTGKPYRHKGKGAFDCFDEEWAEECIGDEVAYLKCMVDNGHKYYIGMPTDERFPYVTAEVLRDYGVCVHSSTPRIYGYVQYLLGNGLLPVDDDMEEQDLEDGDVDVPQHISIGHVNSWQTDGAETTESYSQEDSDLLLSLGREYRNGRKVAGVVLNDIGTIHEHGIGTGKDVDESLWWYAEAVRQGDRLYAPTNMGDIYRRGTSSAGKDLGKAVEAFLMSEDPYAWYRIGQSYEEGWTGNPDLEEAMRWYDRAAAEGHHLALARLARDMDQ